MALVHGDAQVGVALAKAPVAKVLFTGSPTVGRAVARECVSREKEVTVELGGKDAMLVLADCNVARAAEGALWAGCAGAGQARGAIERVYVAREVSERFVARLVSGAAATGGGRPAGRRARRSARSPPRDGWSTCASWSTRRWPGRAAALRRTGVARGVLGSVLRAGGDHRRDARDAPDARALDGPVLAVMTVDSIEQAIALANDSEYGLGASVWSTDRYRGLRIARELHAGMVWLNDHLPGPAVSRGPWGAAAGGGLGRTLGEAGLRACAQEKLIAWSRPGMRGLWWGPYDQVLARRRASGGAAALGARLRPRARVAPRGAWRSRGWERGRCWGAGCRGRHAGRPYDGLYGPGSSLKL